MIICPVCETENENHEEFCILCGAKLQPTPTGVFAGTPSFTSEIETALDELLPLPDELPFQAPASSPTHPEVETTKSAGERDTVQLNPTHSHPLQGSALTRSPEMPASLIQTPMMTRSPEAYNPLQNNPLTPATPPPSHHLAPSVLPNQHLTPPPPHRAGYLPPQQADFLRTIPEAPAPLAAQQPTQRQEMPPPGTLCLVVYFQRRPALYFPVLYDEILLGRTDPASNAYPDLDLTPYDPDLAISRKHTYIYREQGAYYIYPISNSGTQVNQEMVDIGTKKLLKEGDVLILSGRLAIRFARS